MSEQKDFFMPKFEDNPRVEEYYQQLKGFLIKTECSHTDKRVYSISYELKNGDIEIATVGCNYKNYRDMPIVAIFQSDFLEGVYYIVVPQRGLPNNKGEIEPPIMEKAVNVVYFKCNTTENKE